MIPNLLNPYFILSLILLSFCLVGIYFLPRERSAILLSSLLSVPAAACEILFIPEYWQPTRISGFIIGMEDIIFSFATGGIVWIIISVRFKKNITYNLCSRTIIKRYLGLVLLGLTLIFVSHWFLKFGVMNEALLGILLMGLILLVKLRFKAWRMAGFGSFLFAGYYFIILNLVILLFPEFVLDWNSSNLWSIFALKAPLEEIAWAFVFGGVWSLGMAFVFDIQLRAVRRAGYHGDRD